jgi:hypothetical protein
MLATVAVADQDASARSLNGALQRLYGDAVRVNPRRLSW